MMKFDEFVFTHPTCRVVENSQTARSIYESIIWNDTNRIKMVELSDSDIPALVSCSTQIENFCAKQSNCDIDIANDTVKQVVGRMISVALAPLGYQPSKKKRLPQSATTSVFKNATAYSMTGTAIERIEKHIVPITK